MQIAVLNWSEDDGIARHIEYRLIELGHQPTGFYPDEPLPTGSEAVITNGPYGKLLPVLQQIAEADLAPRPKVIHWNTEGLPDLRIPFRVMRAVGFFRSWLGRFNTRSGLRLAAPRFFDRRMLRFRYLGDYLYAHRKGWLDVLADSSRVYTQLYNQNGIPACYVPWGSNREEYADLGLVRDIDVLWMGTRGSRRRSQILDEVRGSLRQRGVEMHVADNVENPFIFDEERTEFLNRSKITLNLTRTWYDDNYSRFTFAIANRSLIVSEPLLPHCPEFVDGVHYVAAPIDKLADTILYYLEHEDERETIVENAYHLVTTELDFSHSIARMLAAADLPCR